MRYIRTRHQDGSERNESIRVIQFRPGYFFVKDEGRSIGEVMKKEDGWYPYVNHLFDPPLAGPFADRDEAINVVITNDRKPRRAKR